MAIQPLAWSGCGWEIQEHPKKEGRFFGKMQISFSCCKRTIWPSKQFMGKIPFSPFVVLPSSSNASFLDENPLSWSSHWLYKCQVALSCGLSEWLKDKGEIRLSFLISLLAWTCGPRSVTWWRWMEHEDQTHQTQQWMGIELPGSSSRGLQAPSHVNKWQN